MDLLKNEYLCFPKSPMWLRKKPENSPQNLGVVFWKLIFLLYIMENMLLVLENTPLIFSALQLPGPTLVGLEWRTPTQADG